jgi:hypothetical protein
VRRNVLIVAGLVLVIALLVAWKLRGSGPHDATHASAGGTSGSAAHISGTDSHHPIAPASLSGRVTTKADGRPVAGAVVTIAHAEIDTEIVSSDDPATIVVTDASGAWTSDVKPGRYHVSATAQSLLPGVLENVVVGASEQRRGVDIQLETGGVLVHGTVSDIGGGPIGGARVKVKTDVGGMRRAPELATQTAADGTYQLTLADGEYHATADSDDYIGEHETLTVAGKPITLDFTLVPGGVVRGIVVARESGKPVPRALVLARSGRGRFGGNREAFADEDGKFTLKALSSGLVSIRASGRGYASVEPATAQLGIGEQVDGVQVIVDRAYSISGHVVRKEDPTKGVPGVRVGAFTFGGDSGGQALAPDPTDETGAFEIVGVRTGSYMLFAFVEGMVPEIGKGVDVADKDLTGVTIEMSSGVSISGRVEPGLSSHVGVELQGEVGLGNLFQMVRAMMVAGDSDQAGAFTLRNVPPGELRVVARTKDGRTGKLPITVADRDQSNLVVPLQVRASVSGRVVDTNGTPVAGERVVATLAKPPSGGVEMSFGGRGTDDTTAADGTFRIVGLDAGTYSVAVRSMDDMMMDFGKHDKTPTFELVAGVEKTGVKLTIDARDGTIRGQVVTADGEPAADAWVTAHSEPPKELTDKLKGQPFDFDFSAASKPVLTGPDGKFTIAKLRKNRSYRIVAEGARGGSHAEKSDVKAGDTVSLSLVELGSLSVRVTNGGTPVAEYDVSCRGPTGSVDRHSTAPTGSITLAHLAPGEYSCDIDAPAGPASGKATVASSEAHLELTLARWASVTGIVVDTTTGKPLPGINVVVTGGGASGNQMMQAMLGQAPVTDAAGKFKVDHVAPGPGAVMLLASGSLEHADHHEFTATEGQLVDLGTIKLAPKPAGSGAPSP